MARRHTPYHQRLVELGAELGDRIGFDAAIVFTSTEAEHMATRTGVGLYDVYYQGPIDIKGPDAEALLDRVLVRDVPRRLDADGRAVYSSMCNKDGGMIDDLTAYRLSPEHYWIVATPARAEAVLAHMTEQARGLRAYLTNAISGTAYLSVQGPGSRDLLTPLAEADLSTAALPYFRFTRAVVADVPAVLSRTGYSGELGYELYYPRDYALHIWDSLVAAGATPAGLGALRSVRMEKRYPLYGLDVNDTTSPLEASLAWAADLDKPAKFVGREALRAQRHAGVTQLLAGISLPDLSLVPAIGDAVTDADGREVGTVTSADRGYFLGKALAMAYLPPTIPPGSEVTVTSAETGASATGVTTDRPFYDPENARVRS